MTAGAWPVMANSLEPKCSSSSSVIARARARVRGAILAKDAELRSCGVENAPLRFGMEQTAIPQRRTDVSPRLTKSNKETLRRLRL
jgi:hypothetical protein